MVWRGDVKMGWGGGESGIRTHDTLASIPVFETGAIDRSATSPPTLTSISQLATFFQAQVSKAQFSVIDRPCFPGTEVIKVTSVTLRVIL